MIKDLYKVLDEFKEPCFHIETKIYNKILSFVEKKLNNKPLGSNSEFYYEKTAFCFIEGKCELEGWEDLHYIPNIFFEDKNGNAFSNPDIKHISLEMIEYYEKRSNEVKNPILQCRYAGLVWDFSKKVKKKNPDVKYAHRFIDSTIRMSQLDKKGSLLQDKLKRALDIGVSIKDKKRIASVKNAIISYEKKHSEDDKAGTWGYSYDWLIADKKIRKKVLLTEEENQIIGDLEIKLKILSDKTSGLFDPSHVEKITKRLVPYYKNKEDEENKKRVLLTYRDSFLNASFPALVGAGLLEKVRHVLLQYGLVKESKEIEPNIRSLQKASLKEFKEHTVQIPIHDSVIKGYFSELDNRSLSEALEFLICTHLPDKEQSKDIALQISREYPLQFLFTQNILDDYSGRSVAKIKPIGDEEEGHTIRQMVMGIFFNADLFFLRLEHLSKTKSLNVDTLSSYLLKSPFFEKKHHQIIKQGVKLFFEHDYISSISILVPQIEAAIRSMLVQIEGNIYTTSKEEGVNKLISLGGLLRGDKFIEFFNSFKDGRLSSIPSYLQVLLVDERGFNIRNKICHGDCQQEYFSKQIASLVIHALLVFTLSKLTNKYNSVLRKGICSKKQLIPQTLMPRQ